MANLVIKSNNASTTFRVQQKVFKLPFEKDRVELTITPTSSRVIDSKDFRVGPLPPQVSRVVFENLGNKIVAIIYIKQKIVSEKVVNLNIPIFGVSKFKRDSFNVIESTDSHGEVVTNSSSQYTKSTVDGVVKYIVNNRLEKKTLILTKTFSITPRFKFTKPPSYTITGNANRYQVVTEFKKNKKKELVSKTFKFYYTSPPSVITPRDTKIDFLVRTHDVTPLVSELRATNVIENKIYSVDQGKDPGPLGGIKRMVVRGVPGTTFKVLVSNSSGGVYDINNGNFSGTGAPISGTIPNPTNKRSYGESIIRINIPRTATNETISTRFLKDENPTVQAAKIEAALIKAKETGEDVGVFIKKLQKKEADADKEILSLTTPTLVFKVDIGDFLGPKVKVVSSGVTTTTQQIFLTANGAETLKVTKPGVYPFKFKASSTGRVQVVRQSIFTMPETAGTDNFVSGSDASTAQKLAKLASDGSTAIVTDWDWGTVQDGANIKLATKVVGVGKIHDTQTVSGTDLYTYTSVMISGEIIVGNVGNKDDTVTLELDHFLERTDV